MIEKIIIKNQKGEIIKEFKDEKDFSWLKVRKDYSALTKKLIQAKKEISTMESCTSGFIASLITDSEGSSAVLKGAYITYSNLAKIKIGVPEEIINNFGVYSFETAVSMAEVCKREYDSHIGIGVTGSFGNKDPNNIDSIPGEVYFAVSGEKGIQSYFIQLFGDGERFDWKTAIAECVYWVLKDNI